MSLRTKLVVALALLAALASAAIGWFSYQATADRLRVEVDRSLDDAVRNARDGFGRVGPERGRPLRDLNDNGRGFGLVLVQVLDASGEPARFPATSDLPVDDRDRAKAAERGGDAILRRDITIDGDRYRAATVPLGDGRGAIQAVRSTAEYERLLASLRNRIVLAVVLVVAAAAAVGWFVARQVTRGLVRVTATAEQVAATGHLDVAVPVQGHDEAARLGAAFNEMLAALARSKDQQQRLVQDAGHELRTPLTSLRTNIAVLRRHDHLPPATMAKVLDDLDGEARELTELTNELVDLATDNRTDEPVEPVALGPLAERVAARARRRSGRDVRVAADATVVEGRPNLLERAIANLVDNATKFDAEIDHPIEVVVDAGKVEVLDRGPGIDAAEVDHVFDRFYRSVDARSRPGSGLGLAIVKDVAESHGGTVFATNRPGGGAVVGFSLPVT